MRQSSSLSKADFNAATYERDFFRWTQDTAEAIRSGRLQEVSLEVLAEEIEGLGKSDRRALRSALRELLAHLLKSQFQPPPTKSWRISIQKQRDEIDSILSDSPSLRAIVEDPQFIRDAYLKAVKEASLETDLPASMFPADCPYSTEEILGNKE